MNTESATLEVNLFGEAPAGEFGTVSIRVVVLPKKKKDDGIASKATGQADVLDLGEDELLPETGPTPMSSYLETGKGGKQCVVFYFKRNNFS